MSKHTFRHSFTALLLLATVLLLSACRTALPGAVIQFANDSIDVGTMTLANDPVKTLYFDFQNVGKETLTISDVRVSCDCMKVEVEPRRLSSWEKGRVKVVLDLSYAPPMGIDKRVGIYSNDANSPATLHITGHLRER